MIFIVLGILCSTSILIVFKLVDRLGAVGRHTIICSYAVSAIASTVIFSVTIDQVLSRWFIPAAFEGVAFYAVFRLIALSASSSGISVTSVASKMSVVVPILVGIIVLKEDVNSVVFAGIICGLVAVWFSVGSVHEVGEWGWPVLVFVGTGLIDTSFKLFQVQGLTEPEFPGFITTIFSFAFLFGFAHHMTNEARWINYRSVLAGVALGLANLGTVYFILMALSVPSLDSILVYSVTNFGTVLLTTVVAISLFREYIGLKGWFGLALAVVSIFLLYLGNR